MEFSRVRKAYSDKESNVKNTLKKNDIKTSNLKIFLRYYKEERELQLWGKNKADAKYALLKTYRACTSSGEIGPKRKQGDMQTPEGFYKIDRFNPASSYYLSLGINYPNESDKILGKKGSLGGDVFIHGKCVTIGCIPITDDLIKELYLYSIESKNNGNNIQVFIFPAKLTDAKYAELKRETKESDKLNLWEDLKAEFDYFEKTKQVAKISFLKTGRHKIG